MVLESIVNPSGAEKHPFEMFLLGLVFASIGVVLAMWVFKEWSSMVLVFLTAMTCIPLMYRTLQYEEAKDKEIEHELPLLKQHFKALFFFLLLFLGFTLAFTLWNLFLPEALAESTFQAQAQTIRQINSAPTGAASALGGAAFLRILVNNMTVLFFCIFFSFFFGAGAIYILAWNASVIGTAMGTLARAKISSYLMANGSVHAGNYIQVLTAAIIRYLPHGIFEVLGFFMGGLAGGIISVAVINHDFGTKKFYHILADSLDLFIISIFIIIGAAVIEVWLTPVIFGAIF